MPRLPNGVVGGLLDTSLATDPVEGSASRDRSPQPARLAALPPNPAAITAGLDAIREHDPGFDEARLLDHARQTWYRTVGRAAPLLDAVISAAEVGPLLETVTVRFGTAGGEEDWVFQRSARATTPASPEASAARCPNCGAPLRLDAAGVCTFCRATVPAAPGWLLGARNRLRPMTADDAAALAAMVGCTGPTAASVALPPPPAVAPGVDIARLGVDAFSVLATAREIAYAVAEARSEGRPEAVSNRVTGELQRVLSREAATMAAEHRHHVLSFLEIDRAVITAADRDAAGDSVTVRMHMSGEEYELADGALDIVGGSRTPHAWSEEWVLTRSGESSGWVASSCAPLSPAAGPG